MIIKKIKPMFTSVITTKDKYGIDDAPKGTIIDPKKVQGSLKEHQKVVAIGSAVRDIQVGDLVKINPMRYAEYKDKRKNSVVNNMEEYSNEIVGFKIPTIEMDGIEYLMIQNTDIEYIIEEYEEEKEEAPLIVPDTSIIIP